MKYVLRQFTLVFTVDILLYFLGPANCAAPFARSNYGENLTSIIKALKISLPTKDFLYLGQWLVYIPIFDSPFFQQFYFSGLNPVLGVQDIITREPRILDLNAKLNPRW